MDLPSPRYFQPPPTFSSTGEAPLESNRSYYGKGKENPFAETFPDPLCKLNLKETSEFVKSLPIPNSVMIDSKKGFFDNAVQRRRDGINSISQGRIEAPPTPGRPVFSFSSGNFARKNFPSKWDDAQKWLISTSYNDFPSHSLKPSESVKSTKQCESFNHQMEAFAEKSRVTEEEKFSKAVSSLKGSVILDHLSSVRDFNGVSAGSTDILLKDKFTDSIESFSPNLKTSDPSKKGFLFKNVSCETMKETDTEVIIHEFQHRDVGTEMTPLGSSTTSRCQTPFQSSSPARHNTPASRSGPLASGHSNSSSSTIDIAHFAKLQLGTHYDSVTSNWSSREEEEEEISKSLRHCETGNGCQKNTTPDTKATTWEEEEKTKCCQRYQREEAKIQAWVNLQSAKAEAQSRKLEVKIQKMRSNLEEKLMKRMTVVNRKAEEWREEARQHHKEQIQKATENAQKMLNHHNPQYCFATHTSCGCFPCNINHRS